MCSDSLQRSAAQLQLMSQFIFRQTSQEDHSLSETERQTGCLAAVLSVSLWGRSLQSHGTALILLTDNRRIIDHLATDVRSAHINSVQISDIFD